MPKGPWCMPQLGKYLEVGTLPVSRNLKRVAQATPCGPKSADAQGDKEKDSQGYKVVTALW